MTREFDAFERATSGSTGALRQRRLDRLYAPIQELGLERNLVELETFGYTVVPPQKVAPAEFVERVRDAVLRVLCERTGVPHSLERSGNPGRYGAQPRTKSQFLLYYLLFEDRVFEDWLENPVLQALVSYTMRDRAQLSSMTSFVKWKGDGYGPNMGLHSDSPASPEGVLPATHDAVCNGTLCLTRYSHEDGAIAMVPGSHRLFRQPRPGDGVDRAVAVEAEVGSLVFWRGNTWHGAFPKQTDGLRLNLTTYFCDRALKTQERYQGAVPDEMLARHGSRFARWVGADETYGWDARGPDYAAANYLARTAERATPR